MKKGLCMILTAVFILAMGFVVYADGTSTKQVNVLNYGAKGNGVTDDTKAIQKAVDYASKSGMTVFFPKTSSKYIIKYPIILKSNTHIVSDGATIFMNADKNGNAMFYSDDDNYISNVSFEGLKLASINSLNGTGYAANSKTSNIEAICIYGINGLTIKNVQMDNMFKGFKLGSSQNNVNNMNIVVDNLNIYNSRTPVFVSDTNNFRVSNSILDANGGYDQRLHSIYIEGDTRDFYFNKVTFKNSPGGGIHIYNESAGKTAGTNMIFDNITIESCKVGVYVWSGAKNIKITNAKISKVDTAFFLNGAYGTELSKISISNFTKKFNTDMGAFLMAESSKTRIDNINIDSSSMGGNLFDFGDGVNGLYVSAVKAKNMNDSGAFYSRSVVKGIQVENSSFEWNSITKQRLSFRGAGTVGTFRNNTFINNGKVFNSLCDNYKGTNVVMEKNSYAGFKSLEYMKNDATNVNRAISTVADSRQ